MVGEFGTVEVREAVLFTVTPITPEETVKVLKKTALFQPSATAIKHIVEETGAWLVEMDETLNRSVRQEEEIPEGTKVIVDSLHGTHLRLDEPGEKPFEECPTSFKHALVGNLSFYGAREELDHIEGQLKDEVEKVFLCDGARGLWKYADTTPRFIGYKKWWIFITPQNICPRLPNSCLEKN